MGIAIGIILIWDVGGLASKMRARLVAQHSVYAAMYR